MKKIVDGKVYDTETSKSIARRESSHNCTDFEYWAEELFLTGKGQYMIFGEGGALSKYSHSIGNNSRGGGSSILLVSEEEARHFAENSDTDVDDIIKHFDVEEG